MGAAFPAGSGWVLGVLQAGDAVTGGPQAWRIEGLRNAEVELEQTIRLHPESRDGDRPSAASNVLGGSVCGDGSIRRGIIRFKGPATHPDKEPEQPEGQLRPREWFNQLIECVTLALPDLERRTS